ncbi:MAG: MoaD/ThiS family protein [Oscillospiraceae bacterium]
MIKVKLLGTFAKYMPSVDEEGVWCVAENEITIQQLLEQTELAQETVKYSTLVNNARKQKDYLLKDGDVLTVMPLFAGG